VQTTDMASARDIQNTLAPLGYRVRARRIHQALGIVVMNLRTPADRTVESAVAELRGRFPAATIAANHRYRPLASADHRQYGRRMIGWEQTPACAGNLRIGMIDTPVSADHPVFRDASLRIMNVLPAGATAASGDHGTAVASVLIGNGEDGLLGLLPGAELLAVNAFRETGDDPMNSNVELLLQALDRLLDASVSVLNLSFGGPENRLLEAAIGRFRESGIPVVAAAGNDRRRDPVYPAAYEAVIAVTALDAERRIMKNASQGQYIDVAAPGVDIWAARAEGGGKYYSGTSFAAPFVSAMVAVLKQTVASREDPAESLISHTRDLGEAGIDPVYGNGLVHWRPHC
jgi:subtilisin family serine protease